VRLAPTTVTATSAPGVTRCRRPVVILSPEAQAGSAAANVTATSSFTTAGNYAFTVPAGVTSIAVTAIGAAGGGCNGFSGGAGASLTANTVPVTPGEELFVGVGARGGDCAYPDGVGAGGTGGGANGGTGSGYGFGGAGGGGGSVVGLATPGFDGMLVVAGGGGGAAAGGNGRGSGQDGAGQTARPFSAWRVRC
jgi:hypothetical protein